MKIKCANEKCDNEFEPKNHKKFCCVNCRIYHHTKKYRQKHSHPCEGCGKKIDPRFKNCRACERKTRTDITKETKLSEYHNLPSIKGKHPSWKNAHIRNFARSWNKEKTKLPCACCNYDKHVELCHIREISNFPQTVTIGEINAPKNIIQLCRNCHWESHNGYIEIQNETSVKVK